MHFAYGDFEIEGFWCKFEKQLIFSRFRPNGRRNRREVDISGSNVLIHVSVDVLGVDFEIFLGWESFRQLSTPPSTTWPLEGRCGLP